MAKQGFHDVPVLEACDSQGREIAESMLLCECEAKLKGFERVARRARLEPVARQDVPDCTVRV
jgi:hypothetical protein